MQKKLAFRQSTCLHEST